LQLREFYPSSKAQTLQSSINSTRVGRAGGLRGWHDVRLRRRIICSVRGRCPSRVVRWWSWRGLAEWGDCADGAPCAT